MITDEDVEKLKQTFTTKDDLKGFATKDELAQAKVDLLAYMNATFATKQDMYNGFNQIREILSDMQSSIDAFLKRTEDNRQEIDVLRYRGDRHEKWIGQLAQKNELKLEY